jgi:hypothetical protein
MKISCILVWFLYMISFSVHTTTLGERKFEQVVDEGVRKAYYVACRKNKEKDCHYRAFEQSIRLKEIF